jgi:anti-anti-sigma factor
MSAAVAPLPLSPLARVEPMPAVRIGGEIDLATIDQVTAALSPIADAVPPGAALIVDAREVAFMSASAVRLLIGLETRLAERGSELVLVQPSHAVRAVLAAATATSVRLKDLIGTC